MFLVFIIQVAALLGDDEQRLEIDHELLTKDKSTCSSSELEMIRRERNRMHAKKTRLRKKKMIQEMEAVSMFNNIHTRYTMISFPSPTLYRLYPSPPLAHLPYAPIPTLRSTPSLLQNLLSIVSHLRFLPFSCFVPFLLEQSTIGHIQTRK